MIVGGVEQYIAVKCQWLNKHGHQTIVISAGGCNIHCLPKDTEHFTIKELVSTPYSLTSSNLKVVLDKITAILKSANIDIVESHNIWAVVYTSLAYRTNKIPFLLNVLAEAAYDKNPILQKLTKTLDEHRLYFTLTNNMNKYIQEKCRSKLHPTILPIPVYHEEIVSTDDHFVLSVCRMDEEKMYVKHAIQGFYNGIKNGLIDPDYKFIAVGEGPLFSEVKEIADRVNKDLNREVVIMPGTIIGNRLYELYAHCTCYIGMGTTLLTAASYSKPCIRTGFQKTTAPYAWGFWGENAKRDRDEIVYTDGFDGTPIEYEKILSDILNNPDKRHELGKSAGKVFKDNYCIEKIMNEWEKTYETLSSSYEYSGNHNQIHSIISFARMLYIPYKGIKNFINF